MEDQQATAEPQHFENIDFNSSPDDNNKESSNNEDNEQVDFWFFTSTPRWDKSISIEILEKTGHIFILSWKYSQKSSYNPPESHIFS